MRKTNCAVCEARCPFGSLHERSQLSSLIRHHRYEKGETIFVQGSMISGCYMLCQGKVQLAHRIHDGHTQIVKFLRDGECFGEEGFWQLGPSSVSAQALTESVVGWISSIDFQELLRRNSALALEIQKRLAGEVKELRVRLAEQAHLGTRERLIKLILELGEKYGRKSDHGFVIDLELTERDLAEMLGNTREWVCKTLKGLKQRGLIAYRCRELIILDEAGLRKYITPPVIVERPLEAGSVR
ncbi:MAG: Crp/Fnr family transcriptional regulator [Candidatus Bipolaricaulota bacterium]|nr:Crp/Fnr family transcriptional regulator [Candidatus Bipolaricaulota bacterium]